jgi:hypothetical protein
VSYYELFVMMAFKVIPVIIPMIVCFCLFERYLDRRKARNVGFVHGYRRENDWR